MATLTLRDENRVLEDPAEIAKILSRYGVGYRRLEDPPSLPRDCDADTVLETFADEIADFERAGGYTTADVVAIRPEVPGLDEMLAKFDREHSHSEDEVRLMVDGRGLFHLHPEGGPVLSVEVTAGDRLTVPAGMEHWFHVCEARTCRAVRLFRDVSGWTPNYTGSGLDERYPPIWHGVAPG